MSKCLTLKHNENINTIGTYASFLRSISARSEWLHAETKKIAIMLQVKMHGKLGNSNEIKYPNKIHVDKRRASIEKTHQTLHDDLDRSGGDPTWCQIVSEQ